ncbi:MAG: rhomboid family intramembrane serine protease [Deltaproteobacteria bacterium]|nr:rhomboid family intramembrane serine protease [Deltaproteobacteria bacterium]
MFLPIGDEPNPRGVAWVNWALIIANVAVFLLVSLPLSGSPADAADPALREYLHWLRTAGAGHVPLSQVSAYDVLVFQHGFRPAAPTLPDAFTSMFLHGGLLHLAGNMLFLWIYGDNVEARLGRVTYLVVYLLAGVAGNLTHLLIAGASGAPLVGASGAISGVLGFYFLAFPENRVRVLVVLFPVYMDVWRIRAQWVLGSYFLLDNLLPIAMGMRSTVAYGAHLGGFLAGWLIARWLRGRDDAVPARARQHLRPPDGAHLPVAAGADAVSHALARGELARAAHLYLEAFPRGFTRDVRPADALVIADWLAARGEPRAALAVYARVLRDAGSHDVESRAHLGSGLVLLDAMYRPTDAWQHLVRARNLAADAAVAGAAEQALARIALLQKLQFRGR